MELKTSFLTTRDNQKRAGIGDCIVVTFDRNTYSGEGRKACIVIDGGYSKTARFLKDYLQSENISDIDLMVATHVADDHISGLSTFISNYVQKGPLFPIHYYWGPAPKGFESISTTKFIAMALNSQGLEVDKMSFVAKSIDRN